MRGDGSFDRRYHLSPHLSQAKTLAEFERRVVVVEQGHARCVYFAFAQKLASFP